MKFPKTLFVRQDKGEPEVYYLAFTTGVEAVDEDGPTDVAIYSLTETKKLRKVVEEG